MCVKAHTNRFRSSIFDFASIHSENILKHFPIENLDEATWQLRDNDLKIRY
jgi:hypothetical protein